MLVSDGVDSPKNVEMLVMWTPGRLCLWSPRSDRDTGGRPGLSWKQHGVGNATLRIFESHDMFYRVTEWSATAQVGGELRTA